MTWNSVPSPIVSLRIQKTLQKRQSYNFSTLRKLANSSSFLTIPSEAYTEDSMGNTSLLEPLALPPTHIHVYSRVKLLPTQVLLWQKLHTASKKLSFNKLKAICGMKWAMQAKPKVHKHQGCKGKNNGGQSEWETKSNQYSIWMQKASFGKLNYGMDKEIIKKKAFLNAETKVDTVLLENTIWDRDRNCPTVRIQQTVHRLGPLERGKAKEWPNATSSANTKVRTKVHLTTWASALSLFPGNGGLASTICCYLISNRFLLLNR